MSNHWSQLVSDDNPRGYNENQKQRIADADTLVKKRRVELRVMNGRRDSEMKLMEPPDDGYGVDRINAMIADIEAEYSSRISTGAVGAVDEDGNNSEGY
jgi:hypothetical protein